MSSSDNEGNTSTKLAIVMYLIDAALERSYYVCCRDGNYKESKSPRKTERKKATSEVCLSFLFLHLQKR